LVIVDHNKNINRIIDVIKADSTVFDNGETVGKLRAVKFGNPDNRSEKAFSAMPYVYVTTKESIQKSSYPYGVTEGNNIPQLTVEYKISVVVSSKIKTQKSEALIYTLLKNLRNTLSTDPSFKTTGASPADPIFTRSVINQVPWKQDTIGQLVTTIDFILLSTIGSIGTIKMSTVNGNNPIEIISEAPDNEVEVSEAPDNEVEGYAPQFNVKLLLKGYAPTGSQRSKSIEIDHIKSITDELRTLKRARKPFSLTTTDIDGTDTVQNAIISQLTSNIARIDNIKTDLIQFLIIR